MVSAAPDPQAPPRDPGPPRFAIGRFDGHEEVQIPAGRPGPKVFGGFLVALPLWILAASVKFGAVALVSGWTGALLVVVIATLVFVSYAVLQILWWLGGSERIAVIDEDLLVRHTIFGMPIATRSYRGRDIRFLDAIDVPKAGWLDEPILPFVSSSRCGRLKFFYHEATVYLGHDLGWVDGKRVVEWLTRRLPSSASHRVG